MGIEASRQIEQRFHERSQEGRYVEALDLVTREAHQFPDYAQKIVYYWRISTACRLNQPGLALQLLGQAVYAGHWYHGLSEDADLRLLRERTEFEELVHICEERRAGAIAAAIPVLKVLEPERATPPYPLLLALHGNQSNVESFLPLVSRCIAWLSGRIASIISIPWTRHFFLERLGLGG